MKFPVIPVAAVLLFCLTSIPSLSHSTEIEVVVPPNKEVTVTSPLAVPTESSVDLGEVSPVIVELPSVEATETPTIKGTIESLSTTSQDSPYDYTINVTGECYQASCYQATVDSHLFSYLSSDPEYSQIAGHNTSGADFILGFKPGDLINVTGPGAGVYRVDYSYYVPKESPYGDMRYDIPKGVAFQTCTYDGRMVLQYATKVG